MPPTRTAFGRRPGGLPLRYARMQRGGFFKSLFKKAGKIVKAVTKIPVIGTVAKAAVGSLPIVGQVQTAVGAFKKKTAQGVAQSPVGGVPLPPSVAFNQSTNKTGPRRRRAKKSKKRKKAKRAKRAAKRSGSGSAKQRAARARFAAAARKGRIKKGSHL